MQGHDSRGIHTFWPCRHRSALDSTQGKWSVSSVSPHTNATSKRWQLWDIDLRFALNSTPGLVSRNVSRSASHVQVFPSIWAFLKQQGGKLGLDVEGIAFPQWSEEVAPSSASVGLAYHASESWHAGFAFVNFRAEKSLAPPNW